MAIKTKFKKLDKNLIFYMVSNIGSKFLIGLTGILLARYLTKYDFGNYTTVTTFLGLVFIFLSPGFIEYGLFEFSKNNNKIEKLTGELIYLFLALCIIGFVVTIIIYPYLYPYITYSLVILIFLKLFLDWFMNLITTILQSKNLFNNVSLLQILRSLTLVLPLILLYHYGYGLNVFLINVIVLALIMVVLITLKEVIGKNINLKNVKKGFSFNRSVIPSSKYFFISALMSYIYMQSDILMLSVMTTPLEVGRYAVVTTIITGAYLIPASLYNYYLPKMTQNFCERDFKKLLKIKFQFRNMILILMTSISLLLFGFPKTVLKMIYGLKYIDSYIILMILSGVLFLHSICYLTGAILTASGSQKLRSNIQIFVAVLNILLNIFAIPKYGAEGAAITTFITEILLYGLYYYFSKKRI
ncbi:flippase [Methanococcus maripaludis]|uniref:O-antigen/teichoic acid export membrane protein n=2 Tax=Methanococcus maripaludis TaxID=39152 RepID=A0A7J9PGD9_METMI|nr:flippase [Methanococcus maripaludis]MBA2862303.1 O-antigen/teichoic acid export membrane protein [Methanococcus maripaludis]